MSLSLVVSWAGTAAPVREAWQQQLDDAGLPAQLGAVDELAAHEGFWPVTWQGRPSGFDWQLRPADDDLGGPVGGRAAVIVAHGDNAPAAVAVAAALAQLMDGQLEDPQSGDVLNAAEVLPWAWERIAACQRALDDRSDADCAPDDGGWGRGPRVLLALLGLSLLAVLVTLALR